MKLPPRRIPSLIQSVIDVPVGEIAVDSLLNARTNAVEHRIHPLLLLRRSGALRHIGNQPLFQLLGGNFTALQYFEVNHCRDFTLEALAVQQDSCDAMAQPYWLPDLNANSKGLQWNVFNSKARCLLVSGPRYSGKCTDENTLILANGAFRRFGSIGKGMFAGEFRPSSHAITSLDVETSSLKPACATSVYHDPCTEGLSVTTASGYQLRASAWHPLWTCCDGKFDYRTTTEIADLIASGKSIAVPLVKNTRLWDATELHVFEFDQFNRSKKKWAEIHGRIKSAIGIGTLLEDGIGDTIRVSLTEDPELEIPVCKDLVKRYSTSLEQNEGIVPPITQLPYSPFEYRRNATVSVKNIGGKQVPVVVADLSHLSNIKASDLVAIGYTYDSATDKWTISDAAADYVLIGDSPLNFQLPGTLSVIASPAVCKLANNDSKYHPIIEAASFVAFEEKHSVLNFVHVDCYSDHQPIADELLLQIAKNPSVVFCLSSKSKNAMQAVRRMAIKLMQLDVHQPIILCTDSSWKTTDEHLIHFAIETGALLLEGIGDGISLSLTKASYETNAHSSNVSGRNYFNNDSIEQLLNTTAFGILQATRTRISKTEYISCPSCGRTLFELQETTAKIRAVTNHLKGLKIAIMGCIVNGPGEMADADFGYVGSGVGKITLYKGKEVMKRNIDSNVAVDELILLLKEHNAWVDPS